MGSLKAPGRGKTGPGWGRIGPYEVRIPYGRSSLRDARGPLYATRGGRDGGGGATVPPWEAAIRRRGWRFGGGVA